MYISYIPKCPSFLSDIISSSSTNELNRWAVNEFILYIYMHNYIMHWHTGKINVKHATMF